MLLQCNSLTHRFGGLVALDALCLNIARDEVVGLLGPNGSGKTTFFNVLSGIYPGHSNSIRFDGMDISGYRPKAVYDLGISRTFQRSRLCLSLSILDNVLIGKTKELTFGVTRSIFSRGLIKREYRQSVDQAKALLARFNGALAKQVVEKAAALSMIDRRRVEICRALISKPKLLLLDEPSAGMTSEETNELMDDILSVRNEMKNLSIIIIEHEMNIIKRITNRCVVLNYGKKIAEGSFDEISSDPLVQEAYLGPGV